MAEYRDRTTGELKSQGELRRDNPNISLPKVWNEFTFDALNVDPVLKSSKPTEAGQYQNVIRDGAELDSNGNWVEAWEVVDMFSDYTDEDGVLHTKAEQEAAYQADLDTSAANNNRERRDNLIAETDWHALSDVTMSAEMTTYRQALRDITTHVNWPHLVETDWPVKP